MPIKLNGATSGSVELDVPDAVGSDLQLTLPATAGEVIVKEADGSVDLGNVDIDSSGRVGIGVTPIRPLDVNSGASSTYIRLTNDTTGTANGVGFEIFVRNTDLEAGLIQRENAAMFFRTNDSERMRIDSSGNVGIGTSSPASLLSLQKGNVTNSGKWSDCGIALHNPTNIGAYSQIGFGYTPSQTYASAYIGYLSTNQGASGYGDIVFGTRNVNTDSQPTERMRIRSTGQSFYFSDTSFVFRTVRTGITNAFLSLQNGATNIHTGTQVFRVLADGDVENTNNEYGALSDEKLKENIVDARSQWEDLKAINVRNFNFKEELGFGTNTNIGVVAQELELVSPGLVKTSPDMDADENDLGTTTKSVKYSVLYMKAVKALQEAMERIETLETKVAALEATS